MEITKETIRRLMIEKQGFGDPQKMVTKQEVFDTVDRLRARKMDRKNRTLLIESIWHEPWFQVDEDFEDSFSEALDSFAEFNGADTVKIIDDEPKVG